jgi:CheY-like chemotaxis protein
VQRLEVRPTHVEPLIENMRTLLRNVLGPGIAKEFFLDTHRVPVLADPTQLELAVLNLAINARDAMPDGGTLTFRTERVEVAGDPELESGEYLKLSIEDTGVGMPADVIDRAFEPFFTTKEVGKGTGLGLSMVYGVARQSGGTARIHSVPGEGTCIELFFRRAQDEAFAEGVKGAGGAEPDLPVSASVLVIDDDPVVREFVAATLTDWGYAVREAGDGPSGLAAFREWRPEVVVVDFVMPGMSGADVARTILEEQPGQPILFVSGYSQTDAIKQAAPGAPLLAKPFRAEALDESVRGLLAARPAGIASA